MEKILSVIVPSYNCREFLEKGIPTFLDPNVLDSLDIIIVNDGSTDDTAVAAERFCREYPNSIRLINQENKGHGGALNTGCAAAVGKYLRIVDADDWVETANLYPFVEFLKNCESDVVLTDYDTVDISNGEVRLRSMPKETVGKEMTLEELMQDRVNNEQILSLHGITYRTDFYQGCSIKLTEHVFYEDVQYTTIPCCFAQTLTPAGLLIYHYRIGDVNQSVSDVNQLKRISHVEKVLDRLMEEFARVEDTMDPGQYRFYCIKVRSLLLRYYTTVLLLEKNRKKGRKMAREMNAMVRRRIHRSWEMTRRQYLVLWGLNQLHISKDRWDHFLDSNLYKVIRNKRY